LIGSKRDEKGKEKQRNKMALRHCLETSCCFEETHRELFVKLDALRQESNRDFCALNHLSASRVFSADFLLEMSHFQSQFSLCQWQSQNSLPKTTSKNLLNFG